MWKPGDIAICVNASRNNLSANINQCPNGYVEQGEAYTVDEVTKDINGVVTLRLAEKPVLNAMGYPAGWTASRFKKTNRLGIRAKVAEKSEKKVLNPLNN